MVKSAGWVIVLPENTYQNTSINSFFTSFPQSSVPDPSLLTLSFYCTYRQAKKKKLHLFHHGFHLSSYFSIKTDEYLLPSSSQIFYFVVILCGLWKWLEHLCDLICWPTKQTHHWAVGKFIAHSQQFNWKQWDFMKRTSSSSSPLLVLHPSFEVFKVIFFFLPTFSPYIKGVFVSL